MLRRPLHLNELVRFSREWFIVHVWRFRPRGLGFRTCGSWFVGESGAQRLVSAGSSSCFGQDILFVVQAHACAGFVKIDTDCFLKCFVNDV